MVEDSYCYPETSDDPDQKGVLRNKFNIRTNSELRAEEYRATAFRIAEITEGDGPKGNFDKDHLKVIHAYIFQDVYEWAGYMRNEGPIIDGKRVDPIGNFAKGGASFLHGSRIDMGLHEALKPIQNPDILQNSSIEKFATIAGQVLGELNYVHPFREGNGRTQETFIAELGRSYGHDVDFTFITKSRMIEASNAVMHDPSSHTMRDLILDATDPNRREALREAFTILKKQGKDPFEYTIRSARPNEEISGRILGETALTATVETDHDIIVADIADLPKSIHNDDRTIHFKATSNFLHHADAHEYLSSTRQEAVQNPALRNAINLEVYIERKLRAQYRNDPAAVEHGLNTARKKIADMIARNVKIETPKVIDNSEQDRQVKAQEEKPVQKSFPEKGH